MQKMHYKKLILTIILAIVVITMCNACRTTLTIPEDKVINLQSTALPIIKSKQTNEGIIMKRNSINDSSVRPKVRGIYVSAWSASSKRLYTLINLMEQWHLNAMVIDIKNDAGQVTYKSSSPLIKEAGSDQTRIISDLPLLIKTLKDKHIYTIARIVTFKDPYFSRIHPEYALQTRSGENWKDRQGIGWLDPYHIQSWRYNIEIAKEAANYGFDEIKFDYVRFPENSTQLDPILNYHNPDHIQKSDAIRMFLNQASEEVHKAGAYVSADVFGLTTYAKDDGGIGQKWTDISPQVDYISPMIYPSHYNKGAYGLTVPDLQPYQLAKHALQDAIHSNTLLASAAHTRTANIRPWLQGFTATWKHPHLDYKM
jgi:hypothetical protein